MATLRDPLLDFARAAVKDDERAEPASHLRLRALYERHGARIHRFLRDLLGDAALASDATQETFVRAYRRIDELRGDDQEIAPFLFGIARNVSLELRRARGRAARVVVPGELARAPERAATGSPETELLSREALRVVDRALDALGDDRRAMLLLRLDHGLSYDDIARLMGFSLAKVKVEIHRARETLRAVMATYEEGGEG